MNLRFEVANDSKTKFVEDIWAMMKENFPPNERPHEMEVLVKVMDLDEYFVVIGLANEKPAFFNGCWILRGGLLFMGHVAVRKSMQRKGLGTKFMKKFLEEYHDKKGYKNIVAEIEIPDDYEGTERVMAEGRLKWYERIGFVVHKDDIHTFPAFDDPENEEKRVRTFLINYKSTFKDSEEFQVISKRILDAVYGEKN